MAYDRMETAMITDEDLSQRLARAAASAQNAVVPSGTVALLVSDARRKAASASLRRRITAGVAGGALVIGGLVATPAAADVVRHFLVQTGWTSEGTEVIADSEWVDTSESDLGAYIEWVYPEWLPLAPGQTKAGIIEQVRLAHAENPGVTQEVGIRRSLERAVYVGWLDEWIAAHEAGDDARTAAAVEVLSEAPSWPAFVATDGGGVTYIMAGFAAELAAGNAEAAQELAQIEGSQSWDGVDRANVAPTIYGKYLEEFQAPQ